MIYKYKSTGLPNSGEGLGSHDVGSRYPQSDSPTLAPPPLPYGVVKLPLYENFTAPPRRRRPRFMCAINLTVFIVIIIVTAFSPSHYRSYVLCGVVTRVVMSSRKR